MYIQVAAQTRCCTFKVLYKRGSAQNYDSYAWRNAIMLDSTLYSVKIDFVHAQQATIVSDFDTGQAEQKVNE